MQKELLKYKEDELNTFIGILCSLLYNLSFVLFVVVAVVEFVLFALGLLCIFATFLGIKKGANFPHFPAR